MDTSTGNVVEIVRGSDETTVVVNGQLIPGATVHYHGGGRVVVSIPAERVTVHRVAGRTARRIALGASE